LQRSNLGSTCSAGAAIAMSTTPDAGVASGLISAVRAPRRRASSTRPAAGWTKAEVPTERKTSQAQASRAAARMCGSSISPNQTTAGRARPVAVRAPRGQGSEGCRQVLPVVGGVAFGPAAQAPDRAVEAQQGG